MPPADKTKPCLTTADPAVKTSESIDRVLRYTAANLASLSPRSTEQRLSTSVLSTTVTMFDSFEFLNRAEFLVSDSVKMISSLNGILTGIL
jgi:hypothetical protein